MCVKSEIKLDCGPPYCAYGIHFVFEFFSGGFSETFIIILLSSLMCKFVKLLILYGRFRRRTSRLYTRRQHLCLPDRLWWYPTTKKYQDIRTWDYRYLWSCSQSGHRGTLQTIFTTGDRHGLGSPYRRHYTGSGYNFCRAGTPIVQLLPLKVPLPYVIAAVEMCAAAYS